MEEPKKHRGTVVHVEGVLWQVRRYDPPLMTSQAGVRDWYEGWLFEKYAGDTEPGLNPVCLIFTELPSGLTAEERMKVPVQFDGYFFKRYRYVSRGKEDKDVPLLIGHGPVLAPAPAAAGTQAAETNPLFSSSGPLLTIFLGSVAGVVVLAAALHLWFRRGDRAVRARLAAAAPKEFVEPTAGDFPEREPSGRSDPAPFLPPDGGT
jgi:hypothetical protein